MGSAGGPTGRCVAGTPRIRAKKYEDSSTPDFYADAAMPALWFALARCGAVLVDQGVADSPRRQSAHQAAAVWHWMISRHSRPRPEVVFLAERHCTPAETDVATCEGGLLPVLHLLHVAQHKAGDHRIRHGTHGRAGAGLLPANLFRQHAGTSPAFPGRPRVARVP